MKDWVIVTTWFASLTPTTWSGAIFLVLSYLKINSLACGPSGPQANRPSAAPPYQPARCTRANSKASESFTLYWIGFDQIRSVAQSCPTLCDTMNRRMPGLPVHHQLPEFTETHVHWVSDAIQPSHPLLSPSPLAPNPAQHQSLFQWVNSSHEVAKV